MADPFSVLAGTAGLADVCIRLSKLIKQAKEGFQTVDEELEDLFKEVASIRSVNNLVQRSYEAESTITTDRDDKRVLATHWQATQSTLAGCRRIVEQLDALLEEILKAGDGKHVKLGKLRRWLKQQSKEETFNALRQKLSAHQIGLQTSLAAVNV